MSLEQSFLFDEARCSPAFFAGHAVYVVWAQACGLEHKTLHLWTFASATFSVWVLVKRLQCHGAATSV